MLNEAGRKFQVPQQPIPEKEIKTTFETDVVVVGAGTSGKSAALSAAEAGARVIQIDKHVTFRWGGGMIAAIDSRLQKKLGVKIDVDDMCLQLMKWGANKPNQRLYRLWAEHGGPVMDWLMDLTEPEGIKTLPMQWPRPDGWDPKNEYYPDYPVAHMHSDGKNIGLNHSLALNVAQKKALSLGVEIRYQTPAVQLIRQPNGRVTGVIARNKDRDLIKFNARKAVILCTGDYGNNPWMMQQYCPEAAEVSLKHNIYMTRNQDLLDAPAPLNVGDGHQMAMLIGAVMEEGFGAPMSHATVPVTGANAFLRVNTLGERYENEDVPAQSQANSLVRQPGKKVWQIFDAKWENELSLMGFGLGTFNRATDMTRANVRMNAVQSDSLKGLAEKTGLPFETFKTTVERINLLAHRGRDLDFGKRADRLTTVERPPFYASLIEQHILVVLGGLITNTRFQPLDSERRVIPGLYLAGNTVGCRFAVDYPTMVAGLSHSFAWVSGRLTGQYAAAEK